MKLGWLTVTNIAGAILALAPSFEAQTVALHPITDTSLREAAPNEKRGADPALKLGPGVGQVLILEATADATIRKADGNRNRGGEPTLSVQTSAPSRSLVQFDAQRLESALASSSLVSAHLEVHIERNGGNWGPHGRMVDVHRVTAAWGESRVTWNCAHDSNLGNQHADCAIQWSGATFTATPSASVLHTRDLGGWLRIDVTADVATLAAGSPSHGWLIKARDEQGGGHVDYDSREGTAAEGPRLLLVLGAADTTAPTVAIGHPEEGSFVATGLPTVDATYSDDGSGVEPASVRLLLDDVDRTAEAQITTSGLTFAPALPLGEGLRSAMLSVRDRGGNESTAGRQFTVDTLAPAIGLRLPAPIVSQRVVTVEGTLQDADAAARAVVNGIPAEVDAGVFTTEVLLRPGTNSIAGVGIDRAGNRGTATVTIVLDISPPQIEVATPAPEQIVNVDQIRVAGTASDDHGIRSLVVDAVEVPVVDGRFETAIALAEGRQEITLSVEDLGGNRQVLQLPVHRITLPVIEISSPEDLATVASTTVEVTGTVTSTAAAITVNGRPALLSGGSFVATEVPLVEGGNLITAVAMTPDGGAGTDTVHVVRDLTPPWLSIDLPRAGAIVADEAVTVVGLVNDIVAGTVNATEVEVTVNGHQATVANRSFLAEGIPLSIGENSLQVVAIDESGNRGSAAITVRREAPSSQRRIVAVSGRAQQGTIGTELAEPLVVAVSEANGQPLANWPVVCAVTTGNGSLAGKRQLLLQTAAAGRATSPFVLGTRAGLGTQVVEATATGVAGTAAFVLSALGGEPAHVVVDSGDHQTGIAGEQLPRPLVAVVTDAGHNRLPGVAVKLAVVVGGGRLANGVDEIIVSTDTDGRVIAPLTLGPEEGVGNNVVVSAVDDAAGVPPVSFTASGLGAGLPAQTAIRGVVLDNENQPVPGVTLRVIDTTLTTRTGPTGTFRLEGAPIGTLRLLVDGSTAERPGAWPDLEYVVTTIPGRVVDIVGPIFLLPLNLAQGLVVDEVRGGTLTLPEFPGFSLDVAAGSVTFPGGGKSGVISVTVVHSDKVPMVPNFGQQPRFIVTIQPAGARFDPPARLALPNVEGLAPGEVTELYSFDHDLGHFVSVGPGTVSGDGKMIVANPGVGVVKAGWHCGGNPSVAGIAYHCQDCQKCEGGHCANDGARTGSACDDKDPCTVDDECSATTGECQGQRLAINVTTPVALCVGSEASVRAEASPSDRLIVWRSEDPLKLEVSGNGSSAEIRGISGGKVMLHAADSETDCERQEHEVEVIVADQFDQPNDLEWCDDPERLDDPNWEAIAVACLQYVAIGANVMAWGRTRFWPACQENDGPADAARHANFACSVHSDPRTALYAADLLRRHENYPDHPCESHEQDLNNNAVGRSLADDGATNCGHAALQALRDGRLQVNNPPVGVADWRHDCIFFSAPPPGEEVESLARRATGGGPSPRRIPLTALGDVNGERGETDEDSKRDTRIGSVTEGSALESLGGDCVVSVLNRSARVQRDGSWVLANVPANQGPVRVRATCVVDGVARSGQSGFITVPPVGLIDVASIDFAQAAAVPSRLAVNASRLVLDLAGQTSQLAVVASYTDGTTRDLTSGLTGTSYRTSQSAIATVSPDGLVTAHASGRVLVSALNEGALGLVEIGVVLGGDSDQDGLPDDWELANGLDPNSPVDALTDPDQDGLTVLDEFLGGLDPFDPDSDDDGLLDGREVNEIHSNPLLGDSDGDGIWDGLEVQTGSDPLDANSYNLAQALQSLQVSPAAFTLTVNAIVGEASQQLAVTGYLVDGRSLDLTSVARGTSYASSDLLVCNFGSPAGRVFASADGHCAITVANSGFSAVAQATVRSFTPTALGFVDIPGYANNVEAAGDYAYVAAGATGLQVLEVADRTRPVIVGSANTAGNANDVAVVGSVAYVADGGAGLQVIDVADPSAPRVIASFDTPGLAQDVTVRGNLAFVADGGGGLRIIDVSDPTHPAEVGALASGGAVVGVDVNEARTLAVLAKGGTVEVVDVANPAAPVVRGAVAVGNARDVVLDGRFAFVADVADSFTSVDVADPAHPRVAATTPRALGGLLHDVAVTNGFAFGADIFFVNGVSVIDVKDGAAPVPRAILDFSSFRDDNGTGMAVDGVYVYLTAATAADENGSSGTSRLYVGQYLAAEDPLGIAPTVSITSPEWGQRVIAGGTLPIAVRAVDDVAVSTVSFLVNGNVAATDSSSPYEVAVAVPAGVVSLTFGATASDLGGNVGTAEPVEVEVIPDPLTTVAGVVVDDAGAAVAGAAVETAGGRSGVTDGAGSFAIAEVPTTADALRVTASVTVEGILLHGRSASMAPVRGGTTDFGAIVVRGGISLQGAVAHYSFNDVANPGVDAVGNHAGTLSGATATTAEIAPVAGNVGALALDGQGGHLRVSLADDFNALPGQPMSFALWANLKSLRSVFHLFGKRSGCFYPIHYQLARDNNTHGLAFASLGGVGDVESGEDLPLNEWVHLALVFDGVTMRFYVNGSERDSSGLGFAFPNADDFLIGNSGTCPATQSFPGLVDEVYVFARALGLEEVQALAGLTVTTRVAGTVLDAAGSPVEGAAVAVAGGAAIAAADGSFLIAGVPTNHSTLQVTATASIGGVSYSGVSLRVLPVRGGTTDVGNVVLRPGVDAAGEIAHWSFDDQANPTSDDVGSHHGILVGPAVFSTLDRAPVPGNAAALVINNNGGEMRVPFAEDLNFDAQEPMSLALWVKQTFFRDGYNLLGKREGWCVGSSVTLIHYLLHRGSPLGPTLSTGATYNGISLGRDLPLGRWAHLAFTFDGVVWRAYLDGVEQASKAFQFSYPNQSILVVGNSGSICPGAYSFPGTIDEVYLFERTLSAGEVAVLAGVP